MSQEKNKTMSKSDENLKNLEQIGKELDTARASEAGVKIDP
jgi:hypothetical protein